MLRFVRNCKGIVVGSDYDGGSLLWPRQSANVVTLSLTLMMINYTQTLTMWRTYTHMLLWIYIHMCVCICGDILYAAGKSFKIRQLRCDFFQWYLIQCTAADKFTNWVLGRILAIVWLDVASGTVVINTGFRKSDST